MPNKVSIRDSLVSGHPTMSAPKSEPGTSSDLLAGTMAAPHTRRPAIRGIRPFAGPNI
jgi:hypothetical protein